MKKEISNLCDRILEDIGSKEIKDECFEGIRDQDGWETLELTVQAKKYTPKLQAFILDHLKNN